MQWMMGAISRFGRCHVVVMVLHLLGSISVVGALAILAMES